jgi:hypothetical protein
MGHGLEKMLSRGKKLVIQVAEGKKRPEVPLQAAKLASETGVALRDNLPNYTSWKLYQNEVGQAEVGKVLNKVAVRHQFPSSKNLVALLSSHFNIVCNKSFVCLQSRLEVDVRNEGPSKAACTDIIKKGVRQTRYHLKRKYFDESLSREQLLAKEPPPKMNKEEWIKLVDYWCDPKNQVHARQFMILCIYATCTCGCE